MKTYKKTIESPKLVIEHDESSTSPREWSNLGYFITVDRDYRSPDLNSKFESIVKETGETATSQAEHVNEIGRRINEETTEKVLAIYPIVKYEHSGVYYSLGTKHGFDYSNNGFYIITEKTQKELGTEKKDFVKVIESELEVYNKWCNGECYQFCLYNEQGDIEDSCGGFYDIEEIREYLPEEWKNEDLRDYIKY
jgi:hypothetical protein